MRKVLFGVIAAGLAFGAVPAFAELDEAAKQQAAETCQNPDPDLQVSVNACTTLLDNVVLGPKSKAAMLYFRGTYHTDLGQHDAAIADYDQAIALYSGDADKATWPENIVGMIGGSYSWRAKSHEALKNCDQAKADYRSAAEMATEVSERRKYEAAAKNVCKS